MLHEDTQNLLISITTTPPIILNDPKYYPFFKDALGAINGTHINCNASAEMHQAARDCKGSVTQNCLAICGFDMIFYYIFSGWDGSVTDSTMFHDARMTDLHVLVEYQASACSSRLYLAM